MNRHEAWRLHGETVQQMVADNRPRWEIIEKTGLSAQTITNWVTKHGWSYDPPRDKVNTKTARVTGTVLSAFDKDYAIGSVSAERIARQTSLTGASVGKILRQHRAEQWEEVRLGRLKVRTCTGCLQTLPVSDFPERQDRLGKMHSQCFACRRDWTRTYRHDNPVPIREASRRRRARLGRARTDGHREDQIDMTSCWFCAEPIDAELTYPDPMALSIHHIHPISKRGPDVLKNVAAAHAVCNRLAKDNYRPPFNDWAVAPMPTVEARRLVVEHHYLHRAPNASYSYGCYDEHDRVRGVIIFGSPSSRRISQSVSIDPSRVIELNRLWIDDSAPFGVGSWFVARAMKQLVPSIVVAYADLEQTDPRYGSEHFGGIYRACSFHYAGASRPNTEWVIPGRSRNVGKHAEGAVKVRVSPKARYWKVVGSRSDRRALTAMVTWPSLPTGQPSPAVVR